MINLLKKLARFNHGGLDFIKSSNVDGRDGPESLLKLKGWIPATVSLLGG